jgi:hypothetical protein
VDKVIFGRLNYNSEVLQYPEYQEYYNYLSRKVIKYCVEAGKKYHIKQGTTKFAKSNLRNQPLSLGMSSGTVA